jgi:uncharacterized membrane protein YqjE
MGAFGRAVADLAAHSAALLGTRLELLGLEAQDVRDRLLGRLALLLAAAVFLLLALLVATLTVALYFWPTEHRFLALWLLALGYAVVGAGLAATLLKRLRQDPAPFAATADVLRQDARAFGLSPADAEDEDEPARSPAVPGEIP